MNKDTRDGYQKRCKLITNNASILLKPPKFINKAGEIVQMKGIVSEVLASNELDEVERKLKETIESKVQKDAY